MKLKFVESENPPLSHRWQKVVVVRVRCLRRHRRFGRATVCLLKARWANTQSSCKASSPGESCPHTEAATMSLPPRFETPPSKQYTIRKESVTRPSSTRSKGINFNTVSPYYTTTSQPTPTANASCSGDSDISASSPNPLTSAAPASTEFHYDYPLPATHQLASMDIDEQLRLLALKEMTQVEVNDRINTLKSKLNSVDSDIRKLREIIQKSLYKEMSLQQLAPRQRQVSNPREEALQSMKTGRRRSSSLVPRTSADLDSARKDQTEKHQLSSLWNNLSKPITFIHQLDNIIHTEMERSLNNDKLSSDDPHAHHSSSNQRTESPQRLLPDSEPSPSKSKFPESPEKLTVDLDKYFPKSENTAQQYIPPQTEDMFLSVSSSIWSFVNEVKTNVMATVADEPVASKPNTQETVSLLDNLDGGSPLNLIEITEPSSPLSESDADKDEVDLTIYSSMRRKKS